MNAHTFHMLSCVQLSPLLHSLGLLPRVPLVRHSLPTSINLKQSPTDMSTGQLDYRSLTGVPFLGESRLCQVNIKVNHYKNHWHKAFIFMKNKTKIFVAYTICAGRRTNFYSQRFL